MVLKDIERDLHKKDSELVDREHDKTVYNVWQSKEKSTENKKEKWQHKTDELLGTRIKAIIIGTILTVFALSTIIISSVYVIHQRGFFSQERVSFVVTAPQAIDSNTLTEVFFTYNNDNRASLNNSEIIVQFGDYFVPEENQEGFERVSDSSGIITIGKIKGNADKTVSLAGHFTGPVNAVDDVSGILKYTPERTQTKYELQARATTEITSSPLAIDITAPNSVVSGNILDIAIVIKNTSADTVSNIKLIFKTPQTFTLQNAEPSLTSQDIWLIDSILPHSEKRIEVRGVLNAPSNTVQMFDAEVGSQEINSEYVVYANTKYTPRIEGSPITMIQKIININGDVVHAGDALRYNVTFTNNSDMPLRDVIASVQFDTTVIDFEDLQLYNGGEFNMENKEIIWKASDVPGLKVFNPRDTIKVSFIARVLKQLPVQTQDDYNFMITTIAAVDSDDIPSELKENKIISSNAMTVLVGAKVLFNVYSEYKEGMIPPKVDEKTVYTINMAIDNINNDLSGAQVRIPLPTYVNFINSDNSQIKFNERTNEVIWNIGDIMHGAGVTNDKVQAIFNISFVPSVNQVGDSPIIIKKQVLTAIDKFTNQKIVEENSKINTRAQGQQFTDAIVQR